MVKGNQHRQGRLCSTILLEPSEDITAVTDQRDPVLVLQSVFLKAFGKKSASERNGQDSQARIKNGALDPGAAAEEKEGAGISLPGPPPGVTPCPPWNAALVGQHKPQALQNQQRTAFTGNC